VLAGVDDGFAGALYQFVGRHRSARDSEDREVEQPMLLQPVQRAECHLLGKITGNPEDH